MIDMYDDGSRKFKWWQDWRGQCVAVVASGPSVKDLDLEQLKRRIHVIVINENYKLCPWADILYSCDPDWWRVRRNDVKSFSGIKLINGSRGDPASPDPTKLGIADLDMLNIAQHASVWVNDFLFDKPGVIGSGGNSGFQMINLAAQFGSAGIGLVGFDMNGQRGIHWHGSHPSPLRNPDHSILFEWRKNLDKSAPKLKKYDIDVVNCSKDSALTAFPKMSINQMLERWGL